jgi:hypothetical protein
LFLMNKPIMWQCDFNYLSLSTKSIFRLYKGKPFSSTAGW